MSEKVGREREQKEIEAAGNFIIIFSLCRVFRALHKSSTLHGGFHKENSSG